jgi:hypothetical protein
VVQFFEKAYTVSRSSSIVFVCGGNDDKHMRMLFRQYCREQLPEYEIFLPEAAMENVFSGELHEPFDLAQFEELVGELAHAIVVFPEGPGSFAETGYFSAVKPLAQKCVLVLDSNRQRDSSFISLGPARKFASYSVFQLPIQLDYAAPAFEVIGERIRLVKQHKYRKTLQVANFNSLTSFEISAILHEIVNLCSIATFDDVVFVMEGYARPSGDYKI